MDEKKTTKTRINEWWHKNKKLVKTGLICGLAGAAYGFIKGALTVSNAVVNGDIAVVRPEKINWNEDTSVDIYADSDGVKVTVEE